MATVAKSQQDRRVGACGILAHPTACPRCGAVAEGVRCVRCNALKVSGCEGGCSGCGERRR